MKTLYATKSKIKKAFDLFTVEDMLKAKAIKKDKKWVKEFLELTENKEKAEAMFIVTSFVKSINMWFHIVMNPWNITDRSKCNHADLIDATYDKVEKIVEDDIVEELDLVSAVIEAGKAHYLYLVSLEFLNELDEVYLFAQSETTPYIDVIKNEDYFDSSIILRFNNLSMRGGHRVKLWDTFIKGKNPFSKRGVPGDYYNLAPEDLQEIDNLTEVDSEGGAEAIRNVRHDSMHLTFNWVPAIHPHISNADACYGGWLGALTKSSSHGFLWMYAKHIRGYLNTWTPESPYWNINRKWKGTYSFEPIGRRKNVSWSVIDTEFASRAFNYTAYHNTAFQKLVANEKHINGYYTREFIRKAVKLDRLRDRNFKNTIDFMETLFRDNYEEYWDNPWRKLKIIWENGWKENTYGLNMYKSGDLSSMLDKLHYTISNILNDRTKEISYEEFIEMDKIEMKDFVSLEDIAISWKIRYMENQSEIASSRCEYLLGLVESDIKLNKAIDKSMILTYEREVKHLNTRKEDYINAIKLITNDSEQAQLFPV